MANNKVKNKKDANTIKKTFFYLYLSILNSQFSSLIANSEQKFRLQFLTLRLTKINSRKNLYLMDQPLANS